VTLIIQPSNPVITHFSPTLVGMIYAVYTTLMNYFSTPTKLTSRR